MLAQVAFLAIVMPVADSSVTTVHAGAGPEEVELAITLPLEEELLEVEGIKKMFSNSMENLSVISLELDFEALTDFPGTLSILSEKRRTHAMIADARAELRDRFLKANVMMGELTGNN